jgi:hypothetical protein
MKTAFPATLFDTLLSFYYIGHHLMTLNMFRLAILLLDVLVLLCYKRAPKIDIKIYIAKMPLLIFAQKNQCKK